ncbi:conserved hypothetical protein [Tenacibaculum maritimum]|uniref:ABC-three component system middle component 6 n=1 Tax=Tenacibaculum maritimum TaxID=107401 RepID=UPI0012E5B24C|nr:ABC-three component system middle component 6 [Tenacibaculum maritimum]CAA0213606.1 conserved hypothetical protein [Tenacibaculum maritimum]
MLLPDNMHPDNSIYFNGATVLNILSKKKSVDFIELYQKIKELSSMSFPTYILCLDWLYLINLAELKKGKVYLCS